LAINMNQDSCHASSGHENNLAFCHRRIDKV
jgi:hypothetical protein